MGKNQKTLKFAWWLQLSKGNYLRFCRCLIRNAGTVEKQNLVDAELNANAKIVFN